MDLTRTLFFLHANQQIMCLCRMCQISFFVPVFVTRIHGVAYKSLQINTTAVAHNVLKLHVGTSNISFEVQLLLFFQGSVQWVFSNKTTGLSFIKDQGLSGPLSLYEQQYCLTLSHPMHHVVIQSPMFRWRYKSEYIILTTFNKK